MAYLQRRPGTKNWWMNYLDDKGNRVRKSTKLRYDDPKQNAEAHAREAEYTARELRTRARTDGEIWAAWVEDFLARHCSSPKTLNRYRLAWRHVYAFLRQGGVGRPSDLTYQHCLQFLAWRQSQKRRSGRVPKLNTALHELTVLKIIMRQAMRLGFVQVNVCDRLGVAKERPREKPELTDADITLIRTNLATEPAWMATCFEIALHTGCRLQETVIAMRYVDFARDTLTFASPKGGAGRAFSVPLPKALRPLLEQISMDGAKQTAQLPPMPSKLWWQFFDRIGRSDLCFHCTRVTFVTRLARAGVPLSVAMRLVNHSSSLVHRIYQRLSTEDVRQWATAIAYPATPAETPTDPAADAPTRAATSAPPSG